MQAALSLSLAACERRVAVSAEPSLADLVTRARGGDRDAFAAIYHRFAGAVHAVVLARVRWGDAGDVVQEVFLAAWQRLPDLREPEAFAGWIMTIARHRAIDAARRPRLALAREEGAAPAPLSWSARAGVSPAGRRSGSALAATPPAPTAEANEALAAIRALPEAYREILLMRLVEGMSGPEIAERTGLQEGSVRVNLHRGMKLLRERLGVGLIDE